MLKAYEIGTDREVRVGEVVSVHNHRDSLAELERCERANEPGRDGKIVVRYLAEDGKTVLNRGYYYARVADLEVREVG